MAILIVGLGNMGEKYEGTRHNIGFAVANALANKKNATFLTQRYGDVAKFSLAGQTVFILKPSTFMNRSGDAVRYWMQAQKVALDQILIITDDLALPFGKIRIRAKGSAGGHNGLTDVEQKLQTQVYARMRMGVGSDFEKGRQVDYVLGYFSPEEQKDLDAWVNRAAEACLCFASRGLALAMNQFNS
jgi:PTH1 family peptidyl-tRNA hydrolase